MTAHAATTSAALAEADAPKGGVANDTDVDAERPRELTPIDLSRAQKDAIQRWLDWQCRMIAGVHSGGVYVPASHAPESLQPAACWPVDVADSAVMLGFAEQAYRVGRSVLHKAADDRDSRAEVRDFVAFPVLLEGNVLGVVGLSLEIRSDIQRKAVVQLIEWGSVWLHDTLLGLQTDRREDARLALQSIAALSTELPLAVAAHQVCNLLADAFRCSRVALGIVKGMQVQVLALSNQVQFDRRLERIIGLQAAMEECIDQEAAVCLPRRIGIGRGLTRAHARLLALPETNAACSIPILTDQHAVGALTLVWDADDHVDAHTLPRVEDIAHQLAPVLALKQRAARSLWRRAMATLRQGFGRLFGVGHLTTKLVVLGVLGTLTAVSLIQTDRRIAADSVIEGTTQQAIVAPLRGYLIAAHARAGDAVRQGQVLATVDDRELRLERQKWQSERDKHRKEYQEALGARDRAKISVAAARIAQAEAELNLVADKLERTQLRAPFDGTLVSGDLSRSLGAPLERGQLLFEIVPNDSYRVHLQVDEHDIAGLDVGQAGDLRLTGMPATPIGFTIERIVPLAIADQQGNRFRVEASLDELPAKLRPGMQGVAKVVTGRTSLLHAWSDELIDRLHFWIWSLGF